MATGERAEESVTKEGEGAPKTNSKTDTKGDTKAESKSESKTNAEKAEKTDKDVSADAEPNQASELPAEVKGKLRRLDKLESRYHGKPAAMW